jgi:HK97 family phage major capsid protein
MNFLNEMTKSELLKKINDYTEEASKKTARIETIKSKEAITEADVKVAEELSKEVEKTNAEVNELNKELTERNIRERENAAAVKRLLENTQNDFEAVKAKVGAVDNESKEYAVEFTKAMVEGEEALNRFVKNKHGVSNFTKVLGTTDQNGMDDFGAIIPTYISNTIQHQMEHYGNLIEHCEVVTVRGISRLLIETLATDPNWHGENTPEDPEERITIEGVAINPRMIKKHISVTDELMYSTGMELMNYIRNEFIRKILVFVEKNIISGEYNNGKGILGLTTEAKAPTIAVEGDPTESIYVKKLEAVALAADTAPKLLSLIDGENEVIFMNKKTYRANYQTLLDTTGKPIFGTNLNGQIEMQGVPVKFTSALKPFNKAEANEPVMIAMAKNAFTLNAPNGMNPIFMIDPYTKMTEDKTRVLGKLFICGRPAKIEGAAVLLKKDVQPI